MSTIIFPAVRSVNPPEAWICCLCSQCGHFTRYMPGEDAPAACDCRPEREFAVSAVASPDKDQVWRQLTDAGVADHVIGRVLDTMFGRWRPGQQ